MSILIKGMEMPESCYYCPFADGVWQKNKRCLINGEEMPRDGRNVQQNHLTCPIIEVPPHGRLIDADVLLTSFKESIDECHKWANEIPNETEMYARVSQSLGTFVECSLRTKGMPTVIPADKDGEA